MEIRVKSKCWTCIKVIAILIPKYRTLNIQMGWGVFILSGLILIDVGDSPSSCVLIKESAWYPVT
jgi:hypothetical protein